MFNSVNKNIIILRYQFDLFGNHNKQGPFFSFFPNKKNQKTKKIIIINKAYIKMLHDLIVIYVPNEAQGNQLKKLSTKGSNSKSN